MTGRHKLDRRYSSADDATIKPVRARLWDVLERVGSTLLQAATGTVLVEGYEALFDQHLEPALKVTLIALISAVLAALKGALAVSAGSPDGSVLPVGRRPVVDKDAVVALRLDAGPTVYGEAAIQPTGSEVPTNARPDEGV